MSEPPQIIRMPTKRPLVFGDVQPERREQTPQAEEGLADETGIEIDNAIERPKD